MYPQWTVIDPCKEGNPIAITNQTIDIWKVHLDSHFPNLYQYLNADEIQQGHAFYQPIHQERYLKSHAFLKWILKKYIDNFNPKTEFFIINPYGKPKLSNPSKLAFNLSHSDNFALVAISSEKEVGIDIEKQRRLDYRDMACLCFSEEENQYLTKCKKTNRMSIFFSIWSQKEAFIKACGMGLSYPTQEFSVHPYPQTPYLIQSTWKMIRFTPMLGFSAAVCCHPAYQLKNFYFVREHLK